MDSIFKKDDLSAAYEAYTDFDRYKRQSPVSMENYVMEFEKLYNKTRKYSMTLPQSVLAFKLLDGAELEGKDRQSVLTGVDYFDADHLFIQMSRSLKKIFGKQSMPANEINSAPIKLEPVYNVEEETYYTDNRNFRGRGPQNR